MHGDGDVQRSDLYGLLGPHDVILSHYSLLFYLQSVCKVAKAYFHWRQWYVFGLTSLKYECVYKNTPFPYDFRATYVIA